MLGGNDRTDGSCRGDDGCRKGHAVSRALHGGDEDRSGAGGVGDPRTGHAGHDHVRHHDHVGEASLGCGRPGPSRRPTRRVVTPPVFMRFPARMKKGIASSGKVSMPPIIRCMTALQGNLRAEKPCRRYWPWPSTRRRAWRWRREASMSRNSVIIYLLSPCPVCLGCAAPRLPRERSAMQRGRRRHDRVDDRQGHVQGRRRLRRERSSGPSRNTPARP